MRVHSNSDDRQNTATKGMRSLMKIKADFDLCESNGVCVGMAPDVFDLDEDDYLVVLQSDVPAQRREEMRLVVSSCPKSALTTED